MMRGRYDSSSIAALLGAAALALIAGALGFEYLDHLPPCEMCMWQRYPHFAAACVGLFGGILMQRNIMPKSWGSVIVIAAALLIALSGAIGVYHAGVEWHFWKGPSQCTGSAFQSSGGPLDLNAPVVMCDHAAWRLFGVSLAGYNAVISLAVAATGLFLLARSRRVT
jgi:disulfide bond formation protein DsbB